MEYCERIKIEEEDAGIASLHLVRYEFARNFCQGRRVLDSACGTGYGVTVLHESAREVIAIDKDQEAIRYAQRRYHFPNASFLVMDTSRLGFAADCFEAVCSFETLEHLIDPETYLGEIVRTIRSDGVCIVSVPNAEFTTLRPRNPHHHQEWNRYDFEALLSSFFDVVEIRGVRRKQSRFHQWMQKADFFHLRRMVPKRWRSKIARSIGTTAFHEMEINKDIHIGPYSPDSLSMVALCRQPKKGA